MHSMNGLDGSGEKSRSLHFDVQTPRQVGFTMVSPTNFLAKIALVLENGAGEGIRTLDPDLGKVVLYP